MAYNPLSGKEEWVAGTSIENENGGEEGAKDSLTLDLASPSFTLSKVGE